MVVKLCLKSLHEFVRLQTFNRSGFQQIQLDIQFLRTPVREAIEDEATIDFLLDEVPSVSLSRPTQSLPCPCSVFFCFRERDSKLKII